jgi:hypothetical protein
MYIYMYIYLYISIIHSPDDRVAVDADWTLRGRVRAGTFCICRRIVYMVSVYGCVLVCMVSVYVSVYVVEG